MIDFGNESLRFDVNVWYKGQVAWVLDFNKNDVHDIVKHEIEKYGYKVTIEPITKEAKFWDKYTKKASS